MTKTTNAPHWRRVTLHIQLDRAAHKTNSSLLIVALGMVFGLFSHGAQWLLGTWLSFVIVIYFAARASYYAQRSAQLTRELEELQ